MDQEFDLWGDPIPPRPEKRGRPPHEPTGEKRNRVKVLCALKMTRAEIAAAMGISEPTLKRYYFRELAGGLAMMRAKLYVRLWDEVEAGSVSAIKLMAKEFERADVRAAQESFDGATVPPTGKKAKADKRGKKERAAEDALTAGAGTDWGDDLHVALPGKMN